MVLMVPALMLIAPATQTPDAVLDDWHLAAAKADADWYFSLMTPDAVFWIVPSEILSLYMKSF